VAASRDKKTKAFSMPFDDRVGFNDDQRVAQSFQSLERQTQKRRSRGRRFGRLTVRLRTRSCWRRTRISVASDILEKNRDRKNRKTAEKMAIRVKRSISDEGDGQENRIAASSAKCKGNKAGWSFYQGHGVERRKY
jgi:hypothetical protein